MSKTGRVPSKRILTDLDAVAEKHGFTLESLRLPHRTTRAVEARADCYRYLRTQGWSTPEIGALFNRDHTTVVWALDETGRRNEKLARYDQRYCERKIAELNGGTR